MKKKCLSRLLLAGMGKRSVQTRENEMHAMTAGRSGSFVSYKQYEPGVLGLDQYSGSRNRSNFYPPDYELGGYQLFLLSCYLMNFD